MDQDRFPLEDALKASDEPLVQYEAAERAAGFTQVSNVILRGYPELSEGVKLTYIVLTSFAYASRRVFPGLETLARARDLRPETMSRHLHELEDIGLIEIIQRGKCKTNIYIIKEVEPERVLSYLEEWGQSGLRTASSHSGVGCVQRQVTEGGDLRTASSPVVKEDEGTYEEDEETTRGSSEEDLQLINEVPSNATTKWGHRLQAKLRRYSGRSLDLVTTYLEIAEEDPHGKAKSDQGKCSRLDELRELEDEFGTDAWTYALQECRRLGKAGTAYAKRIMQGFDPDEQAATRYDKPAERKPKRYNPTSETIVGWDALDEVMGNDD